MNPKPFNCLKIFVAKGNSTIVRLLLSVGAKNSISDEYGATPLLYAALHNKHVSTRPNFVVSPRSGYRLQSLLSGSCFRNDSSRPECSRTS